MKLQTANRILGRYPRQTKLAITIARAFIGGAIASSMCQPGIAAPKGGVVAAGSAEITSTPSATLIRQNSNRAVIDWASFNIAAGEAVKFVQPGGSAAALNRIHDASPSQIFGQLNANGQVYLVNPNGIVFGRTASINVGSLMASTADIANADFMAGRMNFAIAGNPRAAVVNEGSIAAAQGGFVALAAPNVRNSGIITARLGRVTLASGDSFTLDFYGDSLISVALDRDTLAGLLDSQGRPATRYVGNDSSILADGGRIEILAASAQNLLAATVNLGGIVRARGVESRNGVIFLDAGPGGDLAVSGKLDVTAATGGTGGRIAATGATVSLLAGALADASGAEGGGTIVLGDMAATAVVNVAPGAVVAADAASRGDGGAVRLFSSGQTRFAGSISATGGDGGGNGGSAEISSTGSVIMNSSDIRLTAPAGRAGTVILDPTDLTIAHQPDSANVVSDFTLYNLLAAGNNVSLAASNDLTVAAVIEGRGGVPGGSVTLGAGHNLLVQNHILTNNGAITLSAGNLFSMAPNTMLYAGNQTISLSGAHGVTAEYLQTDGTVNITSSGGPVTANRALVAGSVNINAFLGAANATINPSAAQTVSPSGVKTTGAVLVNAYSLADGGGINAGGNVALQSAQGVTLSEYVLSGGSILVRSQNGGIGAKGFDTTQQSSVGAITLDAAGNISVTENVLTHNSDLNATASDGVLQISGAIDTGSGSATLTAAGDMLVNSVTARNLTATTTSSGSITVNSPMADLQHVALDSSQDITLHGVRVANGLTAHFRGNLNILDNILATNGSAIELGAPGNSNTNGKINLYADILSEGGDIRLNNDVDVFNFRGMNSASAFLALPDYPNNPAAIHMVSDTTGGSGTATSFKSLIFIDNTLVPRGGTITLNMGHITNEDFYDEFNNKSSNRLVVSAMMSASDIKSLINTSNIVPGQAITYPAGDVANPLRYARHDLIGGTFFANGNLPERIYRPNLIGPILYYEALNQYGFFYPQAGSQAYRLVISGGTVPTNNSTHAADWLGQFRDPGQGSGTSVVQPTSPDIAFSGFLSAIGSPGDSVVPQPGVVGPPAIGIPATVGNGNVALALAAALGEAIFRTSDLVQAEPGTPLGETELAIDTAANTAGAGESGITTDIVLGGPGMLAAVDFGRGTPLGGAAQDVFGKRRCIALGAPGVSAQPCVGASR